MPIQWPKWRIHRENDSVASESLRGKIKNMGVVEDFTSRPRKAVTFLVERDKEFQALR